MSTTPSARWKRLTQEEGDALVTREDVDDFELHLRALRARAGGANVVDDERLASMLAGGSRAAGHAQADVVGVEVEGRVPVAPPAGVEIAPDDVQRVRPRLDHYMPIAW
jgi:hypothetical protein